MTTSLVVTRDEAAYIDWCAEHRVAPRGGPTRRLVYPHDLLGLRGPDTTILVVAWPVWMSEQQLDELARFIRMLEDNGATVTWGGNER